MSKTPRLLIPLLASLVLLWGLSAGVSWYSGGVIPARALNQIHYVAPGGDCGSASPCYASIQAAVDAAASGDEIRIAAGEYSGVNAQGGLSQVVYLAISLTLQGGYTPENWSTPDPAANQTTIHAQGQGRAVAIRGPAQVSLDGLRITGGNAAGLRGDPNNPTTNNAGGGIYIRDANVTLSRVVIYANTASSEASKSGLGGGLYAYGSHLTLSNSIVEANLGSPVYYGSGGGLYFSTCPEVTLTDNLIQNNTGSTNPANAGGGNGGGLAIYESQAVLTGNSILNNTVTTGAGGLSSASGGGIYISGSASQVTLNGNTISGNIASLQRSGWGGGVAGLYGCTLTLVDNLISGNSASAGANQTGQGGGVYTNDCDLNMQGNRIRQNTGSSGSGSSAWGGGVMVTGGTASLHANQITANVANSIANGSGGGLYLENAPFELVNNIVANNQANLKGSGLLVSSASAPGELGRLLHNTIADNTGSGEGLYADYFARLVLTNTIVSGQAAVGVFVNLQASASLESTLWFDNGTNTGGAGAITPHNDYSGDPLFVAPLSGDYHIAAASAAIDKGAASPVSVDLDGESRPAGAAADLGADEYYPLSGETYAEKAAFAPQWLATFDPGSGLFQTYLSQRYLLHFQHFGASGLSVTFTDTLPVELSFAAERHYPAMAFSANGATLTWQTDQPLPPGQAAQVLLTTISEQIQPLESLTNQAEVRAGEARYTLSAITQAPLAPPLISAPGQGEICPGVIAASGLAIPNTTVTLYADGSPAGTTTAGADGRFSLDFSDPDLGYAPVELTAVACLPGAPGQCSPPSPVILLTAPLSFVCPQRSLWEHTPPSGALAGQHLVYRFRNEAGIFVGDGADFAFVPPHAGSQVHLYARSCEQMGTPPVTSQVVRLDVYEGLDRVAIYYPDSEMPPVYEISVAMDLADGVERDAIALLGCTWEEPGLNGAAPQVVTSTFSASLGALNDQTGTIFDVTAGLDPAEPGLSGVAGVTVTAMFSNTEWGGWMPWVAGLTNGQLNPQVTGADGYFAFFAPPGIYYLQVDGGANYYSWRSPVIQVGSAPLHLDIPLTPRAGAVHRVVWLEDAGPSPALVKVAPGQVVEFRAPLDTSLPIEEQLRRVDHPRLHPLTSGSLDPRLNPLGFDAGLLSPGSVYRRQFTELGTFEYSDGAGHSGIVLVQATLYLPLAQR